jgi:hypothetical protein
MQPIKRWIYLGFSLCLLVFTGMQAWGTPFSGFSALTPLVQEPQQKPLQQPQPDQPKQDSAKSATFTGTVAKDGEQYVLRDSSGAVYKLDDSERAKAFEGKAVKVMGRLDTEAKLIHVESIEGAES